MAVQKPGSPVQPIRFVISDVDGTLLDANKQLTSRAIEAVKSLRRAGIGFTFVSARPPRALKLLAEMLELDQPFACFNGAMICSPLLEVLRQELLDRHSATHCAQVIVEHGLDLWAFVGTEWYATETRGPHTENHRKLLGAPKQMSFTLEICSEAAKLVGVSDDREKMAACEAAVIADRKMSVSVSRSSDYYLDVTNKNSNKGLAVELLSAAVGIPAEHIATIGDMPTDTLMFAKAGFSVAMGQSEAAVKNAANVVTDPNSEEGFAKAVERFLLS